MVRKTGIATISLLALFLLTTALPSYGGEESLSFTGTIPPIKKESLQWGKDPFIPVVTTVKQAAAPKGLRLAAVFYNSRNPSAIINEKIVYRGSVFEGQKVIDIGRTHVILQGESGSIRLDIADLPEPPDVRR